MAYTGPTRFIMAYEETVDILKVLYDSEGMAATYAAILDATQLDTRYLQSLLLRLRVHKLVETFRPTPNGRLWWRIPSNSIPQVNKVLIARYTTAEKILTGEVV